MQNQISYQDPKFQEFLETVPMPVFGKDLNGLYIFCNVAFQHYLQKHREDIIGKTVFDMAPPDIATRYYEADLELYQGASEEQTYEWKVKPTAQDVKNVIFRKKKLRSESGMVVGMIGFIQDISELRKIQESLKESQEKFYNAFHQAPDPIMINRMNDGMIFEVNQSLLDLSGYTRDELIGKTTLDMGMWIDPKERAAVIEMLTKNKGKVVNLEFKYQNKKKEVLTCLMSCDMFQMHNEKFLLVHLKDIGQMKIIEAQLQQSTKMAALGTISAGVAHELNNPLAIIKGFSNIIKSEITKKQIDTTALKMACDKILSAGERMQTIIQHMLDFSKDSDELPLEKIPALKLIQDTMVLLESYCRNRDVKVFIHPEEDLPAVVGNRIKLESAFQNLIYNAVDAFEEVHDQREKNIIIRIKEDNYLQAVVFEIEDNACGIRPEIIGRIFDPFFTTKGIGKGTGLGLSVIHGIISQYQGTIDVASNVNVGTIFKVVLPYSKLR